MEVYRLTKPDGRWSYCIKSEGLMSDSIGQVVDTERAEQYGYKLEKMVVLTEAELAATRLESFESGTRFGIMNGCLPEG